jgi:hypothetical protein
MLSLMCVCVYVCVDAFFEPLKIEVITMCVCVCVCVCVCIDAFFEPRIQVCTKEKIMLFKSFHGV